MRSSRTSAAYSHRSLRAPMYAERLESRVLLSAQSGPLTFSASNAPIWPLGFGRDWSASLFDVKGKDWTFMGTGIKEMHASLSARVWASSGTVSTKFGGTLKVNWPDSVQPGQQDVPVTISLGAMPGSMNGAMGTGIDIPLDLSVKYAIPGKTGTISYKKNLEDYAHKLGLQIPGEFDVSTSGNIAASLGASSAVIGGPTLASGKVDLITLGTFIPGAGVGFAIADPFIDVNLGMKLTMKRSDILKPTSLDGKITLNGANAGSFSLTGTSTTIYVDVPQNVGSSVSMDVAGLSLKNQFHTELGLNFDSSFAVKVSIPKVGSKTVYSENDADFYVPLVSTPSKTLPLNVGNDPGPVSIPVESAYPSIPSVPCTVQAENYNKGGEGLAYHDTTPTNEGNVCRADNVDLIPTVDGGAGFQVNKINNGEWLDYFVNVPTAGYYDFDFRLNSAATNAVVSLVVNGVAQPESPVAIPNTLTKWKTISSRAVSLLSGVNHLRVKFSAPGFQRGTTSMNWFAIYASAAGNHDPNDQISEASAISFGSTLQRPLSSRDVDMYGFKANARQTIRFSAASLDVKFPKAHPYLRLFSAKGIQLKSSSSLLASFSFTFATAGTYYIGVSAAGNKAYNAISGLLDTPGQALSLYSITLVSL